MKPDNSAAAPENGSRAAEPAARIMELLDPEQVARELGLNRKTLANWRVKRYGPRWVRVGGRVMYDVRDVKAWLEAQKRGPYQTRQVLALPNLGAWPGVHRQHRFGRHKVKSEARARNG